MFVVCGPNCVATGNISDGEIESEGFGGCVDKVDTGCPGHYLTHYLLIIFKIFIFFSSCQRVNRFSMVSFYGIHQRLDRFFQILY